MDPALYTVRPYRPSDGDACKALEARSNMTPPGIKRALFKVQFEHYQTFEAKASSFPEQALLVCEENKTGTIVGCVCLALKKVRLRGESKKVALLFDLRVDDRVQRAGIGRALSESVEKTAWERGADLMYLTVNGDNKKARRLYEKMGWNYWSVRTPQVEIILLPKLPALPALLGGSPAPVAFSKSMPADVAACYSNVELWPEDHAGVFASEHFAGVFSARSVNEAGEESRAALCIWDASGMSGFSFQRFFGLPASVWSSLVFQLTILSLALWAVYSAATMDCHWAVRGVVSLVLATATAVGVALRNALHEVFCTKSPRVRGRFFAPLAEGPDGRKLFKGVYEQARRHVAGHYLISLCNLDAEDDTIKLFTSARKMFATKLMAKSRDGTEVPWLHPKAFFDPRDI